MAELVEDMLYTGGRLMSCIEELTEEDGEMGLRDGGRYGMRSISNRGTMGRRIEMGERDNDWADDEMNERRRNRR
ncbi:MAG: hypothetical protein IJR13_07555 [Bacteroidales bacterium]|nr:hypothetical protein [Bacteroidales bacterium]